MKKIMYLLFFSLMLFLGINYASASTISGTRCYYKNSNGDIDMVVQKNDSDSDESTIYLLKGYSKSQYGENQDIYESWNIDTPNEMKNGSCPDTLAYTIKTGSNKFEFNKSNSSSDNEYILYRYNMEENGRRCVYSITNKPSDQQVFYYVYDKTAVGYVLNGTQFELIYEDFVELNDTIYNIFTTDNFLSGYNKSNKSCPSIYLHSEEFERYLYVDIIGKENENDTKIYYNASFTGNNDVDIEDIEEKKSLYFNFNANSVDGITAPFTIQVLLGKENIFYYRVYFNGNKPTSDSDLQIVDGFYYDIKYNNKNFSFYWYTSNDCINRLQRKLDDTNGTYNIKVLVEKDTFNPSKNQYRITSLEESYGGSEGKEDNDDYEYTDHSNDVSCGSVYNIPKELPKITNIFINFVKIFTPLILIFKGMMDLFKAVTSSKQDEISKAKNKFFKRLIPAIVVFLVVLLTQFIFGLIATNTEASTISECINCFLNNNCSPNINN